MSVNDQAKPSINVVVLANPSESHPSTQIIEETIESVRNFTGLNKAHFILSHDGIPNSLVHLKSQYEEYLSNLEIKFNRDPQVTILRAQKHLHLSGNISQALRIVKSKYVLLVQHDLPFIRKIEIDHCLLALEKYPEIKHLRFNKEENFPYEFDCMPPNRRKSYTQHNLELNKNSISVIKTLGWSDNNHLCNKDYYEKVVFQIVKNRKIAPEHALNKVSNVFTGRLLGNYIYGAVGDPAAIKHLDGRQGAVISKYSIALRNSFLGNLKSKNRFIISRLEQVFYLLRTYKLLISRRI